MKTTILLTTALLLSALPLAPAASADDCYGGSPTQDAACFVVGAADPIVRTCDVLGLPNLVLCIVNQEVDNAQAYADELCRDTVCVPAVATTASAGDPCDGVVPATLCYVEDVLFVLCIPEPPIVGPLRCFVNNAVDATDTYAGRLCDAVFGTC